LFGGEKDASEKKGRLQKRSRLRKRATRKEPRERWQQGKI